LLYRVFPFLAGAAPIDPGGALYVPRSDQLTGRHDCSERYGALYAARDPESAVAELIQQFRGRALSNSDFRRADGRVDALASINDEQLDGIVDLDDPSELVKRGLRPSSVATRDREVTKPIAVEIFDEGAAGFAWWSTLEASWVNVTLFIERARPKLRLVGEPEPLSTEHAAVPSAAETLGIQLA